MKTSGFSLIETVAASVLLSLAVVTLCTISTRGVVGIKGNREYERAWEVLDRQLTFIDFVGVSAFLEQGQFSGVLGDQESEEQGMAYSWEVDVDEGDYTGLYRIDIAVGWGPERSRKQIMASTYLYDGAGTDLTETGL